MSRAVADLEHWVFFINYIYMNTNFYFFYLNQLGAKDMQDFLVKLDDKYEIIWSANTEEYIAFIIQKN